MGKQFTRKLVWNFKISNGMQGDLGVAWLKSHFAHPCSAMTLSDIRDNFLKKKKFIDIDIKPAAIH